MLAKLTMTKNKRLFVVLIAVVSSTAIGCGGDAKYPEVSGIVTVGGEPTPKVRVMFIPQSVGDNHTPGPFSFGETDADGRFTMRTRRDEPGAVVGPHRVGFHYADLSQQDYMLLGTKPKNERRKKRLKEVEQILTSRPKIRKDPSQKFDVPSEGTTNANFEIGEVSAEDSE